MKKRTNRRQFLEGASAGLVASAASGELLSRATISPVENGTQEARATPIPQDGTAIDFRYAPLSWQTAYCFPDDHHKSLIGERGELRYGHPGQGKGIAYFPEVVEFSLLGMERDKVAQQLEAPGVPIILTRLERPEAFLELTTFATNEPTEGRVDNVLVEVRPRTQRAVHAVPIVKLKAKREIVIRASGERGSVHLDGEATPPFLVASSPLAVHENGGFEHVMRLQEGVARGDRPLRYFLRFPQKGQDFEKIKAGLAAPDELLAAVRTYWGNLRLYGGDVAWRLNGRGKEFLEACARNILQAREERNGQLTFQVGPTVYRGLWVVDGNFILEAARYLGYDAEAQHGLEATWARQDADGAIFAGGGREHWQDTGIAMFTLVRQAELAQDWTYFRKMQPDILRGVEFLRGLRDKARTEGSANGRYGLLARGFGDGGLGGIRSEFTNSLWVLAGVKAVTEAADRLGLSGWDSTQQLYQGLRVAFFEAARKEMRLHPAGFEYLPMLMKEDPQWSAPDEWDRPRPQTAQWAISQAIYPGGVFEKDDPVVQGHIALMQTCTQEDVPVETGWLPHGGLWAYNAMFVAHAYLWAGLPDWAAMTFRGFLNHASPLYCWREEQPLRGSLVASYVGDMPHNWASAECVLYLRHMLALEDGRALRMLAGIRDFELVAEEPYALAGSPTRFGRVDLDFEPLDRRQGWRLKFQRAPGPAPESVQLPANLGSRFTFAEIAGAGSSRRNDAIFVDPLAQSWEASWKPAKPE